MSQALVKTFTGKNAMHFEKFQSCFHGKLSREMQSQCVPRKLKLCIFCKIQLIYEYLREFLMLLKIPYKRNHLINQNNKMFQMGPFWLSNSFVLMRLSGLHFCISLQLTLHFIHPTQNKFNLNNV